MAEILGVVASVAALIELTDMVMKTATKYVNTAKGAQYKLLPLISNIQSLADILVTIEKQLQAEASDSPNSLALQHLGQPLDICQDILEAIKARLDNVKVVGGYVLGPLLDKKTTVCLKHLDELMPILRLALATDSLASINAVKLELESLHLDSVEEGQKLREQIQAYHQDALIWKREVDLSREASTQERSRERLLAWLTFSDPEYNHRSACQRHQPGTGTWIFNTTDFADWETGQRPFLWLSAMAGAGKTILSSTIIRHLIAKYGDASVAYFYFDFKDSAKQDVISLIGSWISQIARTQKPLPNVLVSLFHRHSVRDPERPSQPTVYELTLALKNMMRLGSPIFLLVDALDECRQRSLLLETLSAFFNEDSPNWRIVCTSRAEVDIQRDLSRHEIKELRIQNHHVDHDVSLYVRAVLDNDERLSTHRQGIKNLIEAELVGGAKGMFRWVQCQIDHLRTLRTARDIKLALQQLPPDLDRTYDDILRSVPNADTGYLHRALQLLVFAARPLTLAEVAEAIVVEPGVSYMDEDVKLQRPEDLLDIGKSLFAQHDYGIDSTRLLELSHYSVKEYLLSERAKKGPAAQFFLQELKAQTSISICCLTYLGLDVFETSWQEFDVQTWDHQVPKNSETKAFLYDGHRKRLVTYPFLDYAAKYCFTHCRDEAVQRSIAPLLRDIFFTEGNRRFRNMTYTCVFKADDGWETSYMRVFRYSLISVVARFGLATIVQDLLDNGIPADYINPKPIWIEHYPEGQTALHRAADFGHESVCRILINAGASLEGPDNYDCPLAAAGRSGNSAMVRVMLDAGVNVQRDTIPIARTLLSLWWEYAEGNSSRKAILEVFNNAGAKWSTIGLIQAFSRVGAPLITQVAEQCTDGWTSAGFRRLQATAAIHHAISSMDTTALNALQWLVRDSGGVQGLQETLEAMLHALCSTSPELFIFDSSFPARKYKTEEVLAENMIKFYFRRVNHDQSNPPEVFREASQASLLAAVWENAAITDCSKVENPTELAVWKAEELVVCGDILQALIRGRWNPLYISFFD